MRRMLISDRATMIGLAVILMAGVAAVLGTYWDDAWHTDYGRDDFFIPPHMMLYAGVTVMGGVASLWALRVWYATRELRQVVARPAVRLAILGVLATLLAAPIDEFWHAAFGRDAVVWSPPHMVGFAALFALATGFVLEASRLPGRLGAGLFVAMGALLVAAVHVPVMEYESDVPQFAVLWYLPVLTLGTALAFGIIESRRRIGWAVTAAALAYTGVRVGILGFLAVLDHSLIFVPPIVLPALMFDWTRRLGLAPSARAAMFAAAIYLVYTPFLNQALRGIRLDAADVALGLLLSVAAAWLALAALRRPVRLPGPVAVAAVLVAAVLLVPTDAFAHDPGQGTPVGAVEFVARHDPETDRVRVEARVGMQGHQQCEEVRPARLVARRAGVVVQGPLAGSGPCVFAGELRLPDRGRWFIYAEMELDGRMVEAWVPVIVGSRGGETTRTSDLYRPPWRGDRFSLLQILAGIGLYGVCLSFIAVAVGAVRREESTPAFR